jgi:hypothetical protein
VFAVAFDLDWSDLPARPAFVPVLQELVRRGSGLGMDATVVAGRPPGEDASIDRWSHDAELSAGPQPGGAGDLGSRAGVLLGVGRDGAVLRSLAVNPDAAAAVTQPVAPESLRAASATALPGSTVRFGDDDPDAPALGAVLRATPAGDRIALLLLAVAAALAVMEALLARAASHPEGAGGGSAP